jgi:hypothetical protein
MKAKGSVMQGYLISNEEGKRCVINGPTVMIPWKIWD